MLWQLVDLDIFELLPISHSDELPSFSLYLDLVEHHGIKGQRWGIRRFQNADGTLNAKGRERYGYLTNTNERTAGISDRKGTDKEVYIRKGRRDLKKLLKKAPANLLEAEFVNSLEKKNLKLYDVNQSMDVLEDFEIPAGYNVLRAGKITDKNNTYVSTTARDFALYATGSSSASWDKSVYTIGTAKKKLKDGRVRCKCSCA
jgi:hypothetical protein